MLEKLRSVNTLKSFFGVWYIEQDTFINENQDYSSQRFIKWSTN